MVFPINLDSKNTKKKINNNHVSLKMESDDFGNGRDKTDFLTFTLIIKNII